MAVKVTGLPAATTKGKRYIDDVIPSGDIFKALKGWSKRVVDNYQDLSERTKQLADVGKKLETADEADTMDLLKQVNKIKDSKNKAFERDIDKVVKMMEKYPDGGKFQKFVDEEVLRTQEVADFIMTDKNWVSQVSGIMPDNPDAMKVAIKEIEETVSGITHEKPERSFFDKLMGRSGNHKRSDLGKTLKETQDSIRDDLEYLRLHRITLNKVMYFYDDAFRFYIDINHAAMERVGELKDHVEQLD